LAVRSQVYDTGTFVSQILCLIDERVPVNLFFVHEP